MQRLVTGGDLLLDCPFLTRPLAGLPSARVTPRRLSSARGSCYGTAHRMHIAILHNSDHQLLEDDPGREAREDVMKVASALADALTEGGTTAEQVPVEDRSFEFMNVLRRRQPGAGGEPLRVARRRQPG